MTTMNNIYPMRQSSSESGAQHGGTQSTNTSLRKHVPSITMTWMSVLVLRRGAHVALSPHGTDCMVLWSKVTATYGDSFITYRMLTT